MSGPDDKKSGSPATMSKPSEEFLAYCEAEFERRLNSGQGFDEKTYRSAMAMVMDRLVRLEEEGARS
jgi:hypothetical protein